MDPKGMFGATSLEGATPDLTKFRDAEILRLTGVVASQARELEQLRREFLAYLLAYPPKRRRGRPTRALLDASKKSKGKPGRPELVSMERSHADVDELENLKAELRKKGDRATDRAAARFLVAKVLASATRLVRRSELARLENIAMNRIALARRRTGRLTRKPRKKPR